MKTLLYINENRVLQIRDFVPFGDTFYATVPEKFLICGLIFDGEIIDPYNSAIDLSFLKPVELYLMANTNVDFLINPSEFRTENIPMWLTDSNLSSLNPKIPLGEITSINVPEGESFPYIFFNFISSIDARSFVGAGGHTNQSVLINWKRPTETVFSHALFISYEGANSADLANIYNDANEFQNFPTGTEFYFSDARGLYGDTNHATMTL